MSQLNDSDVLELAVDRLRVGKLALKKGQKVVPTGTAFAVAPNLLVTASHALSKARAEVAYNDYDMKVVFSDGIFRSATIVTQDPMSDIALLSLKRPLPRSSFPWFILTPPLQGRSVAWQTVGYPVATNTDALIISGRVEALGHVRHPGRREMLQLTCTQNAHGVPLQNFSGSPVIVMTEDGTASLLGLLVREFRFRGAPPKSRTVGVAYATPWQLVDDCLRAHIDDGLYGLALPEGTEDVPAEVDRHATVAVTVFGPPDSRFRYSQQRDSRQVVMRVILELPIDMSAFGESAKSRPVYRKRPAHTQQMVRVKDRDRRL